MLSKSSSNLCSLLLKTVYLTFFLFVTTWIISNNVVTRIYDDGYMFSRYSKHIIDLGTISWNPEKNPTYGLTSLLYLMITVPFNYIFDEYPALSTFASSFFAGIIFLLFFFLLLSKLGTYKNQKDPAKHSLICLAILLAVLCSFNLPELKLTNYFWSSNLYDAPAFERPLEKSSFFYYTKLWFFHFLSGMDTTFAMAYVTLYLIVLTKFYRSPSKLNTIFITIISVLAYLVRPELAILMASPVIFLCSKETEKKSLAVKLLLLNTLIFAFILTSLWLYFGTPIVNSFWIKSFNFYGEEFYNTYKIYSKTSFVRFVDQNIFLLVIILTSLIAVLFNREKKISALEKLLFFYLILLSVYFTFFTAQIMGHACRFYQTLMPVLIYLAYLSLSRLLPNINNTKVKHISALLLFITAVVLFNQTTNNLRNISVRMSAISPFENFSVQHSHKKYFNNVWHNFDKVAELPDDLTIALSEVGLPGAWTPEKTLIDLAGLNVRKLDKGFFIAKEFFNRYQPDLIYFHHPVYKNIRKEMYNSDFFQKNYIYYGSDQINTITGVGVYKHSKYFDRLNSIIKSAP